MTPDELKEKFWKSLDDSPFVMLGVVGADKSHTQPMAAQIDPDLNDCIYFYTNRQNRLVDALARSSTGLITFAAKGHDLFACVHGTLQVDTNPAMVEKFWSPVVSAWYEDGKDDADLVMLRFDLKNAEIWNAGAAGFLKMMVAGLFGDNADEVAQDEVARVSF